MNKHIEGVGYTPEVLRALDTFARSIEIAVANGWNQQLIEDEWHVHAAEMPGHILFCYPRPTINRSTHIGVFEIIYSHDFALALFGDWMDYHLQHMVVSKNPLDYIFKFLEQRNEV